MSVFGVVILAGISCHLEWCFHSPIFSGLFMTQTVILLKQRSKKTWVRRLETGIETTEFQRFACAKLCFVYTLKNALPCCLSIEKHNVLLYQINCYRNVFVVAERYMRGWALGREAQRALIRRSNHWRHVLTFVILY